MPCPRLLLSHTSLPCVTHGAQNDHDGGKDEGRWKDFFMERKVGNFSDLTEGQKTVLALGTTMPQMVNAT